MQAGATSNKGGATAATTPASARKPYDNSQVNTSIEPSLPLQANAVYDASQESGGTAWSVEQPQEPTSLFRSNIQLQVTGTDPPIIRMHPSARPQIQATSLYSSTYAGDVNHTQTQAAAWYGDNASPQPNYGGGGYNSNMLQQKKVQHKLTEQSLWSSRSSEHLNTSTHSSAPSNFNSNGQTYTPANRAPK